LSQKLKRRSLLGCSAWLSKAARRKQTKSNWASELPGKQPSRSALPPLHIDGARQADVGEPGSAAHARRERLLRACILLRDRLAAAAARVDAAAPALDAACDAACDAAASPGAGPGAGPGPAAPGARARASDARMAAVFGSSSDDDSDAERADAEGAGAGPQGRGRAAASTAASTRAGAPSGSNPSGRAAPAPAEASRRLRVAGPGRPARAVRVDAPPMPIVDPTERPRSAAAAAPAGGGPAAGAAQPGRVPEPGERAGGAAGRAALPPTVKQKLLQSVRALAAPPLRGCHLACWDMT